MDNMYSGKCHLENKYLGNWHSEKYHSPFDKHPHYPTIQPVTAHQPTSMIAKKNGTFITLSDVIPFHT